ncbi:MAG: tRNA 2-thiouridine(34) synthase MnmA [Gemmatimonadota bacterium]|nr:tRNA 2-thiouridine(34) synthase MnmA [Gemmatimonadota bacterium]
MTNFSSLTIAESELEIGFDINIDLSINRLPPAGARVVVAMSGGVDSSVAAALLKQNGCEVIGITMHLWDYDAVGGNVHQEHGCCTVEDRNDARVVAGRLGIPYYVVDFRAEFQKGVIDTFVSEYLHGRTPNPCVACNSQVKFGVLLDKARALGADYVATGHYARVVHDGVRYILKCGMDKNKDQSYALWEMGQDELAQTVFPIGSLTKSETRRIAEQLTPRVAQKKDSYDICFIQDKNYERFLRDWTVSHPEAAEDLIAVEEPIRPGPIIDTKGNVLGEHRGYPLYTIGQRKGLGLAAGRPIYVVNIRPETNTVVVGDDEDLLCPSLTAECVKWQSGHRPSGAFYGQVKIRYRHGSTAATITPFDDDCVDVRFDDPQRAITPGQSVVFYDGNDVIGGGIIRE